MDSLLALHVNEICSVSFWAGSYLSFYDQPVNEAIIRYMEKHLFQARSGIGRIIQGNAAPVRRTGKPRLA